MGVSEAVWQISIAFLTALLTIASGAVAYRYQKVADRRASLVDLRREKYIEYLATLQNALAQSLPETQNKHDEIGMTLTVVASDAVVREIGHYRAYMHSRPQAELDNDMANKKFADVLLAMRRDCFESSSVTIDELKRLMPVR